MSDPRAKKRHRPRSSKVDPARRAAYDVLVAVREQDAYTNLVLPPILRSRGLTGRDAAFATELVSGTIRRQGTYDAVIAANVDRPLAKVDAGVLDALRLGAHQLLAMRVPSHAAVGTSVDLVRSAVGPGPAGFVNAVLRKVAAHDLSGWVRRVAPDPGTDPVGFASVAHAHPRWVVEALGAAVGDAELDDLLAADNMAPKVTLVARPGLSTVDELVAAGGASTGLSPYAVRLDGGDPAAVPAVAEGRAGVQDEGSHLVAVGLAEAAMDGRDELWLDVCARQEHRARLVATANATAGAGLLGVVAADGTRPAWRDGTFDRVLVDAPCTGLGALRRRPEARWRRTSADLDELVPLQRSLLTSALDAVRPGGVVAYATCSPVLAETAGVVSAVLATRDDVHLEQAGLPGVTDAAGPLPGTLQLWPHRHGTDAMFLALLRRH